MKRHVPYFLDKVGLPLYIHPKQYQKSSKKLVEFCRKKQKKTEAMATSVGNE